MLAILLIAIAPSFALNPPPEATVTATKGPIQLILRIHKRRVKRDKSIWYQLELKNVGRKKIKIEDKVFRDPWAMHENTKAEFGTYLEVIKPNGERAALRTLDEGKVRWDYIKELRKHGHLGPKDKAALDAARADWDRKGLTGRVREDALEDWNMKFREQEEEKENRQKEFWLTPGASTHTLAWAYTNDTAPTKEIPDPHDFFDVEKPIGDYTQLWSYEFFHPGKYRVRAVYHNSVGGVAAKMMKEDGITQEPWEITFETPFVDIQVAQ